MNPIPACSLTDLGLVNALGHDRDSVLAHWRQGRAPGLAKETGWLPDRPCWVGRVTASLPAIDPSLAAFDSRNNRLLLAALAQIAPAVTRAIDTYGRDRVGVVLGSSTSGIREGEQALAAREQQGSWPDDYHYRQQEIGSPSEFLVRHLGLTGPACTLSTACSSSAKALTAARYWLATDQCDAVVAGGSDSLCRLTLNGFTALDAVSPDVCDPFTEGRQGITIGEGAALFLVERGEAGPITLTGGGESTDAHHISAPHPEGRGAEAAMRAALDDAAVAPDAVTYINLHGTGTPLNDAMESQAVHRLLGEHVPCSSTKPLIGHTLGAAGASEAGLCWLLLSDANRDRVLPRQINRGARDPDLPPIALLNNDATLPDTPAWHVLSNSFAFGGSNAALLLTRRRS